ncbi:MAG: glycosyltransferase family protein [Magnetococcales bacterium]|nr:glycosyltransferase family protein [Magnetococcales bacterium]
MSDILKEAVTLHDAGRLREAETLYRKILRITPRQPAHAIVWYNLGTLLASQERSREAETALRAAIDLQPALVEAHNNLGILLQKQERLAEAESSSRQALRLRPGMRDALVNLGVVLRKQKRYQEAEAVYREILQQDPGHVDAIANLGVLLHAMQRYPEAETAYREALRRNPNHVDALFNLGIQLWEEKRFTEAEAAYRAVLRLQPDHANARWNLSFLCLTVGNFQEGWPLFEARTDPRLQEQNSPVIQAPFPVWRGEAVAGKSFLIVTEQGFGDQIQFCRFADTLKAMGASRITLVAPPPLTALLATLQGVDTVRIPEPQAGFPWHDYWIHPLSIPWRLGITPETIPATLPYLSAPPERLAAWRDRLAALPGTRVGLVWKGSPGHRNDANRSLPGLATLAPLWQVAQTTFVSLQKGAGEEEARQPPPGQPLWHLGEGLTDFADTAAVLTLLDLVITIDSAVAHLAGALGKPCWVLLPWHGTDWRWMPDRQDSPWYPGVMRLFRQGRDEDWSGVVARVAAELVLFQPPRPQ